jgi:hypothetical protein
MDLAVLPPWQYSLLVQITQSDVICVTKTWKFGELLFSKQDRFGPVLQYHFQVLFGQRSLLMSVIAKLCVKYSESMINAHAIQGHYVPILLDSRCCYTVSAVKIVDKLYGSALWYKSSLLLHMDRGDQTMDTSEFLRLICRTYGFDLQGFLTAYHNDGFLLVS